MQLHSRLHYSQLTELGLLTDSVEVLVLCDHCCNDPQLTEFNLLHYHQLSLIDIGNDCFEYVTNVHIHDLPNLQRFVVGWKCFYHMDHKGEFHLTHCNNLRLLYIRLWSFYEFTVFDIQRK